MVQMTGGLMKNFRNWINAGMIALFLAAGILSPTLCSAVVSLGGAVDDTSGLTWTTGNSTGVAGPKDWFVSSLPTSTLGDGTEVQSGAITDNESTWIQTSINGPGSLSFYQKVFSEKTYDVFSFYMDSMTTPKSSISGETPWQQKVFLLSAGTHTVRWTYKKNFQYGNGLDAAWLDKVVVSPYTKVALAQPVGKEKYAAGSTQNIIWNAPAAAEQYRLFLSQNKGTTWSALTSTQTITTGFHQITYPWTVPVIPNNPNCKIKVVAYNAANVIIGTAMNLVPFTIETVRVTSPNGGDVINPKIVFPLTYTIFGADNTASATYSYTLTGTSWISIATFTQTFSQGTYTYNWNAPFPATLQKACKVKVEIRNGAGVSLGSDTSDLAFSIRPTYSISGVVKQNGLALPGVTMTLAGNEAATTTTDALGKYTFVHLLPGVYTVSAAKAGSVFAPAAATVQVTTANITTANFTGTLSAAALYGISGTVSGLTGTTATVSLAGPVSGVVLTSLSGTYAFTNLPAGNYALSPVKKGYLFDPVGSAVSVVSADQTGVDFTATADASTTYSVAGKVTLNGAALSGVVISVTGDADAAGVTNTLGIYLIKGLKNGSYTVTPSKTGYAFAAASTPVTIAGANKISINFTAAAASLAMARGTMAVGSPISNATFTIKDANGNFVTGQTNSEGAYSVETTGLTPPLLLLVTTATGSKFYGVSADASADQVINITPYTDLIIRSWYDAQSVPIDSAFDAPGANPPPSPTAVAVIGTVAKNMVQLWLNQADVTAGDFNLISTPFSATGTGVDAVLAQSIVDPATGAVVISDGTTTQNSTLSILDSALTISSTTSNTGGTSSNNNTTAVPVQSAQQTALDDIAVLMGNVANKVTTRGNSLVASDLYPYLDASLIHNGWNKTQFSTFFIMFFKGKTLSTSMLRVNSVDTIGGTADLVYQLAVGQAGQTSLMTYDFAFRKVNNAWLISGNGRIAGIEVRALLNSNIGPFGTNSGPVVEADVMAPPPVNVLAAAAISGGGFWNNTVLPKQPQPTVDDIGTHESFELTESITGTPVPAGTPFTVEVTPVSGPTVTYTEKLNAFTNEPISMVTPTGTALSDAKLGQSLAFSWTLPKTYAVAQVWVDYAVFTGPDNGPDTVECKFMGPALDISATTTEITFPDTCVSSHDVKMAIFSLQVIGVNGENNMFHYTFGDGL